jgi:hypothetical protein
MRAFRPREADVRTVEVESAISLTDERASGPMLTDVQTVTFELWFLPYLWSRPDGKPYRPDGWSRSSHILNLERIWSWSITDGRPGGLLRGPDEKDTSSGQIMLVCLAFGRDEHVVQTDGIVDRLASGRDDRDLKSSIFFTVQSLLKMLWQVESIFTASLHINDFAQT